MENANSMIVIFNVIQKVCVLGNVKGTKTESSSSILDGDCCW